MQPLKLYQFIHYYQWELGGCGHIILIYKHPNSGNISALLSSQHSPSGYDEFRFCSLSLPNREYIEAMT